VVTGGSPRQPSGAIRRTGRLNFEPETTREIAIRAFGSTFLSTTDWLLPSGKLSKILSVWFDLLPAEAYTLFA
jgi:hypothetical protein